MPSTTAAVIRNGVATANARPSAKRIPTNTSHPARHASPRLEQGLVAIDHAALHPDADVEIDQLSGHVGGFLGASAQRADRGAEVGDQGFEIGGRHLDHEVAGAVDASVRSFGADVHVGVVHARAVALDGGQGVVDELSLPHAETPSPTMTVNANAAVVVCLPMEF
jgi:hypothetical protein